MTKAFFLAYKYDYEGSLLEGSELIRASSMEEAVSLAKDIARPNLADSYWQCVRLYETCDCISLEKEVEV